jgi:hypothetical protein
MKKMIQVNEMKLRCGTIELIGMDLEIKREKDEDMSEYIDRVVEELRVSVGEEDPCKDCKYLPKKVKVKKIDFNRKI